jgi:heterodisulfide reductase subunit A-like polyferredoxin
MSLCRKCNTVNEEGLTRCRACNAILPVKIGSKSETRWERVRRRPDLVGMKCPSCGAVNPYTRFRCQSCNAALDKAKVKSGLDKFWLFVGVGAAILATVILAVRAM